MENKDPREIALGGRFIGRSPLRPGKAGKASINAFKRLRPGEFQGPGGKIIPDHPWLTPAAMAFLESILTPESSVLETGAGGSTLWIARRVKTLVTYEHDPRWYRTVSDQLKRRGISNVSLYFDPAYPTKGLNHVAEAFDVLLCDGRGRIQTIRTALNSVRVGGWIMLDNAERARYHPIVEELDAKFDTRFVFKDGWEAKAWKKSKT